MYEEKLFLYNAISKKTGKFVIHIPTVEEYESWMEKYHTDEFPENLSEEQLLKLSEEQLLKLSKNTKTVEQYEQDVSFSLKMPSTYNVLGQTFYSIWIYANKGFQAIHDIEMQERISIFNAQSSSPYELFMQERKRARRDAIISKSVTIISIAILAYIFYLYIKG